MISDTTPDTSFRREALSLHEIGLVLSGLTSEVRVLSLAAIAIADGNSSVIDVHHYLRSHRYNSLQICDADTMRSQMVRSPDQVVFVNDSDKLIYGVLGGEATCVGATILGNIAPITSGVAMNDLTGGYRRTTDEAIPGPGVRYSLFRFMLDAGNSIDHRDILDSAVAVEISESAAKNQLTRLVTAGIITSSGREGTKSIHPDYKTPIKQFVGLIRILNNSSSSPSPSTVKAEAEKIFDDDLRHSIPALVRRSMISSGKSESQLLLRQNRTMGERLDQNGFTIGNTLEIAEILDEDPKKVGARLDRLTTNLNGISAVSRLDCDVREKTRMWQRQKPDK